MEFRKDIIANGKVILGRELTGQEINKIEEAMNGRYEMYCQDYAQDVDIDALFNEDFYKNLKEIIEKEITEINMREIFDGILNKHSIYGEDVEEVLYAVSDILDFMADKMKKDSPYATNTIKSLKDASREVSDLVREL